MLCKIHCTLLLLFLSCPVRPQATGASTDSPTLLARGAEDEIDIEEYGVIETSIHLLATDSLGSMVAFLWGRCTHFFRLLCALPKYKIPIVIIPIGFIIIFQYFPLLKMLYHLAHLHLNLWGDFWIKSTFSKQLAQFYHKNLIDYHPLRMTLQPTFYCAQALSLLDQQIKKKLPELNENTKKKKLPTGSDNNSLLNNLVICNYNYGFDLRSARTPYLNHKSLLYNASRTFDYLYGLNHLLEQHTTQPADTKRFLDEHGKAPKSNNMVQTKIAILGDRPSNPAPKVRAPTAAYTPIDIVQKMAENRQNIRFRKLLRARVDQDYQSWVQKQDKEINN